MTITKHTTIKYMKTGVQFKVLAGNCFKEGYQQ